MRPKGKGNLSDATKAAIIGAKKLQLMSQSMIAEQFDVARFTVNRLSEDDLSPEGKESMKSFVDKLDEIRNKTTNLIIEKLDNKTIKDGVLPTLLNIANQNYRLETDQPTSITAQQNIEPIALAIQSAWNKYKLFCEQNNIEYPSESDLIERINRVANERNVDAKMLAERVLKAG